MVYVITLGLVIISGLVYFLVAKNNKPLTTKKVDPENTSYRDLRGQIFSATPEQIGLSIAGDEKPYAIVMDIGLEETVTLVSIIDGNASIYLSSGGGIIGGFGYENVRNAAIDFVSMGQHYFVNMPSVDSFPLPKSGNVRFYILTNKGKYSVEEETGKMENNKSDLRQLFVRGNKVMTELMAAEKITL